MTPSLNGLRELQVLRGMAAGCTNAEIGQRLHLSENTIKTYNRRLFAELGARDRAHAVSIGYQRGLLRIVPPAVPATRPDMPLVPPERTSGPGCGTTSGPSSD